MVNPFKKIPSISTTELAEKLKQPITLLDVRSVEEYHEGHIAKAISYPFEQIPHYQGTSKEIYLVCQAGVRSKRAAKILRRKGYTAINVRGGTAAWSGELIQ